VPDAHRFGVAELKGKKVIGIEEKPKSQNRILQLLGFIFMIHEVFDAIKTLKPSGRGELEITDVNNYYINKGAMEYGGS
jgi:glucose-1-phosphate thymidylyltransferase